MIILNFIMALLPIIWLVIALSVMKMAAHKACTAAFIITAIEAVIYRKFSVQFLATAALEGILNALWPICLVIVMALFTYKLSLRTGAMDRIKTMLISVSDDKRVLALLIGWGFGCFMEGMAGFGTAVAIPASMLAGIGLNPFAAVVACLVVNSTPTPFGSVGVPVATLASVTDIAAGTLAADIAVIELVLVLLSPFFMVVICGRGLKALKGMIPTTLVASLSFAAPWFLFAKGMGPELPDVTGSILCMLGIVVATRFFNRNTPEEYSIQSDRSSDKITVKEGLCAWSPYIMIFVLLVVTSTLCPPIHNLIADIKTSVTVYSGPDAGTLTFSWINTPGVMIFISAVIGGILQKASLRTIVEVFAETIAHYWKTIVTICMVLAMAKVMGYSGMIADIAGFMVAVFGGAYPLIAPLIGALGAFVTGSGTSTAVLFGKLQCDTALTLGLSGSWMAAANMLGAGIGKMICPQGIAVGASAIDRQGDESVILKLVIIYFVIYIIVAGIICMIGCRMAL